MNANMVELSWDSLSRTVQQGILPPDVTVQVIVWKLISKEDDPLMRYRIMLWDGVTQYKNALFMTSRDGLQPPDKFSVIRLGSDTLPEDAKQNVIKSMEKEGRPESYAFLFHHYHLIKEGTKINKKLSKPEPLDDEDSENLDSFQLTSTPKSNGNHKPPSVNYVTPPNSGTPEAPPAHARNNRSSQGTPIRSNRDAVKRNLEASFPPVKRQNTRDAGMAEEATHPVSGINPHMNRYKIKVRVAQKSKLREVSSSRWQGKVINAVLEDASGQIQLTGFNDFASALDSTLEVGKTYIVTGADVKPVRDTRYNSTGHNYELGWRQNTQVIGPLAAGTVQTFYKFVNISDISGLEKDSSCDVTGWVQSAGPLVEFRSRNDRDLKKRELVLADDSEGGASIPVTLWDTMAVNFAAEGKVIALKGAKIGEWNGQKNLSVGFSGSYEVEPDVPRCNQLIEWSGQLQISQSQPTSQNTSFGNEGFTTIQELKDELQAVQGDKRCKLYGSILKIQDENIFYRAHTPADGTRCMKKVLESRNEAGMYECAKCGKKTILECDTSLRFNVRLSVGDCTSNNWCSMFDAETLFKKSAKEMKELLDRDLEEFQVYIKSRCLIPMVFRCSAKIETYNDAPKLKIVINEVSEMNYNESGGGPGLDWKEVASAQIAEIRAMEAELGVNHEDLYNLTWPGSLHL